MADILNQFVKFNVFGGNVLGKVVLVHSEKFDFEGKSVEATKEQPYAIVEVASGQRVVKAAQELTVLSSEDYNKELLTIIDDICKKANIASIAELQATLDQRTKELEEAKAQLSTVSTEKDTISNELTEAKKDKAKMKDEMDKMCKEKKGCARFDELKALEANEGISKNKDEAIVKLGEMSDEVFAQVKQLASNAFQKLTEIRQTNKPATTDQTSSTQTKSTEAAVTEPEVVVAEAKVEDEDASNLGAAATSADGPVLAEFIGGLLSKNKNIRSKKVKSE